MILIGDCLQQLATIPDQSVHTCVTSPPYFGLRDYQVEGQIGLEATPEAFVVRLVGVFREVRRVLRDDGTLWLNLGDSYANPGHAKGNPGDGRSSFAKSEKASGHTHSKSWPGAKNKDLIGIPWRVAFALQADGWYLRQDIIWHKPNPMPESVTDRCTKSHEYIFLLSKRPKYYFDSDAIREPLAASSVVRLSQDVENQEGTDRAYGKTNGNFKAAFRKSGNKERKQRPGAEVLGIGAQAGSIPWDGEFGDGKRNKRDVWTVTTKPFKEAHFATYPPDLIEPCILAGCPVGGTVLDPFFGAGTTGLVAQNNGRKWIGIELNPEYAAIAKRRLGLLSDPLHLWMTAA